MKKTLILMLTMLLLVSAICMVSCGNETETSSEQGSQSQSDKPVEINASKGLEFELMEDEQAYAVVGIGTCADTDLVIPSTYEGLPVTSIADRAFFSCASFTSVTIPNSVTFIGGSAFFYCTSLESVNIPDSVTFIGGSAFEGCTSLASVTIPDSVTLFGNNVFCNCTALTSVKLSNNMSVIGSNVFSGCSSLKSITIPSNIKSIWNNAFQNCYKLVEIYNLSSLEITVGSENNGYVGHYAKVIHNSLDKESVLKTTNDGYVFAVISDSEIYLVDYVGSNAEITLPKTYNGKNYSVNQYAFYNCDDIKKVIIPNSVILVGDNAFRGVSLFAIYCEATSQPSNWNDWNSSNHPVYWYSENEPANGGNYWRYGENGEIVVWQ